MKLAWTVLKDELECREEYIFILVTDVHVQNNRQLIVNHDEPMEKVQNDQVVVIDDVPLIRSLTIHKVAMPDLLGPIQNPLLES